jgi:hypothetical protein
MACGVLAVGAIGTSGGVRPAIAETGSIPAGWVVRVAVPEAIGGKTVIGQLTVDRVRAPGYIVAYGCEDGVPGGAAARSDLNFDGRVTPAASNRLIVQADVNGDVCLLTSAAADLIVDVNAISVDVGITSFPNRRTDTRGPALAAPSISAGGVVRVRVPEAVGGGTVVGQLTVDRTTTNGYVTAYGCSDGVPGGGTAKSDLNFDGRVTPAASNRLIVQADANGDVCFQASAPADLIVDINATSDVGIASFPNRRTDTRRQGASSPQLPANGELRINLPEARGGKIVIGQLTADRVSQPGYVTAYGCADGVPGGATAKSDLNFDGQVTPAASNRLIVQADRNGDVCLRTTAPSDLIVDLNAVSAVGISSFPNRRIDTRTGTISAELPGLGPVPQWPPYEPKPPLASTAALTGLPVTPDIAQRPIVAVKIDNYRLARPQLSLEAADAVIETNVEGVTRFIALFHTSASGDLGPVRSARTGDLDLLAGMNRPVFAFSGANPGVDAWLGAATSSGVIVDFSAQRRGCYRRLADRVAPHNLVLDAACAFAQGVGAGSAQPLWSIDGAWSAPIGMPSTATTNFLVPMDGVRVEWTWDPAAGRYLRSQDGAPHLAASGQQLSASTVVEVLVEYIPSPVDARSPNAITVGSGTAFVHRDGRSFAVTWTRLLPYDQFTFTDPVTARPVPLDSGVTFIELVRAT